MFRRFAGALIRAAMVAAILLLPVLLLSDLSPSLVELAFLATMVATAFVFFEYGFSSPTFIEFRSSAPYNRMRFLVFAMLVPCLAIALRDPETAPVPAAFSILANSCAQFWTFTGSPLTFFENLTQNLDAKSHKMILNAAALGLSLTTIAVVISGTLISLFTWPLIGRPVYSNHQENEFNLWENIPSFDTGVDGKTRRILRHSGFVSLFLGFSLVFLIPQAAYAFLGPLNPVSSDNSLLLLWMIAIWCFVPALSIIRGVAFYKISSLIAHHHLKLARS